MLRILHKATLPWVVKAQLRLDYLPLECLGELQWRKLRILLRIAYDRTPFYRRRFTEIGAAPEDIRAPEDFAKIPLLTREDILDHVEEMLAYPRETLRRDRSGGSTGHPLIHYFRHDYKYLSLALQQRLYTWVGAAGLRPSLYLWGVPMRSNVPAVIRPWHRLTIPSFRYGFDYLTEQRLAALARDYLEIRPAAVFGYTSLLLALARHIRENGLLVPPPPRAIVTTAETLYPEDRTAIEEAFGAKVYNQYGSHENSMIAGECPARQGLHVALDHAYLEVLARGRPAGPGEPGYLVVTDLDNLAMPFIRYRNDDIGAWSARTCPCGRSLPMLKSIEGRDGDFIFDRDGIAYPGINLMRPLRPVAVGGRIRQFQLRQMERGRLQVLAVLGSVPDPGLEDALLRGLNETFRGKMEIGLTWVESIPPEPSGKTRFVKSTIPYSTVWGESTR